MYDNFEKNAIIFYEMLTLYCFMRDENVLVVLIVGV